MAPSEAASLDYRLVSSLKAAKRNARTHSRKQVKQIAKSIERFGFANPILIDENIIIAGHGRMAAAKLLGLESVPVVRLGAMTAQERQAYALSDNKLALNAGWDQELLSLEFQELWRRRLKPGSLRRNSSRIPMILSYTIPHSTYV